MSIFTNLFSGYQGSLNPNVPTSIASGQQVSAVIPTGGFELCGIFIPATFTGTTVTFLAAPTLGGTYVPVSNAGGQVYYTVAPSEYIAIDPKDFHGIAFLQIKSGSVENATRPLIVSMKGL